MGVFGGGRAGELPTTRNWAGQDITASQDLLQMCVLADLHLESPEDRPLQLGYGPPTPALSPHPVRVATNVLVSAAVFAVHVACYDVINVLLHFGCRVEHAPSSLLLRRGARACKASIVLDDAAAVSAPIIFFSRLQNAVSAV